MPQPPLGDVAEVQKQQLLQQVPLPPLGTAAAEPQQQLLKLVPQPLTAAEAQK